GLRILEWHDLYPQIPGWIIATGNRVEQIAAVVVSIHASHLFGFFVGEEFHALVRQEVVFDPETLALGIDPHVSVGTITVHVTPGAWQPTLTHQVGNLVRRLWVLCPEVPLHRVVTQAGIRQALLRAN